MYRNTPVRCAQPQFGIKIKVAGGSETAEVPNWYDYAVQSRRELCLHDGSSRVEGGFRMLLSRKDIPVSRRASCMMRWIVAGRGFSMLLSRIDIPVVRGGVDYMAVNAPLQLEGGRSSAGLPVTLEKIDQI